MDGFVARFGAVVLRTWLYGGFGCRLGCRCYRVVPGIDGGDGEDLAGGGRGVIIGPEVEECSTPSSRGVRCPSIGTERRMSLSLSCEARLE